MIESIVGLARAVKDRACDAAVRKRSVRDEAVAHCHFFEINIDESAIQKLDVAERSDTIVRRINLQLKIVTFF